MGGVKGSVIHVVEDDAFARESIRMLLEKSSTDYTVVEYESAESLLRSSIGSMDLSQCLLVDLGLPGMDGVSLLRELQRREILIPVLILTGLADVPAAVQAVQAGALDVLQKPVSEPKLLAAIRQALDSDRARRQRQSECNDLLGRLITLSPRERDVAVGLLDGLISKEIAAQHGIGTQTVLKHRSRVLKKLQVRNEVELAQLLNRYGVSTGDIHATLPGNGV